MLDVAKLAKTWKLTTSPNCSDLHSSAGWLALIGLIWLTLAEIIASV